MAKLNESLLKEQIKNQNYSNAYLFYGEESYLKEFYIKQLKNKIVDPTFESFNFHKFDGKDTDLDDIIKDAQMLPMMSEYNFVLVRDYPIDKSKSDLKLIKEFLEDVPESTIFIFYYDSIEPDVKASAFKNLISYFDNAGCVVNMEKRSESDVAKLLVSGAKKRGSMLDINNAKYLISISGNDMKNLLNELDKLSYFAKGQEITKEIIDNMATKCLQARVYDLSKAVVSCNSDAAYGVLDTLFSMKEDPILITSVVSGVYVDMYRVKCAKSSGNSYDDVAKHFNYRGREFALRNASRDCASLSEKQLRNSLDVIMDTDLKLKSTATDKKLLIEEMIVKLIMIARENTYA
jgi:DNA polymerase-3 subunit delta